LFVPKFVQVYQFIKSPSGTVVANEWFEESLSFDTKSTTAPTGAVLRSGLDKAWVSPWEVFQRTRCPRRS
jgi:hypothetical protein